MIYLYEREQELVYKQDSPRLQDSPILINDSRRDCEEVIDLRALFLRLLISRFVPTQEEISDPFNAKGLTSVPHDLSIRIHSFRTWLHDAWYTMEVNRDPRPIFDIVARPRLAGARFTPMLLAPRMSQRRKTMDDERGEKEEPRKWRIPVIKSLVGRRTAG